MPAHFNNLQRTATENACMIANLKCHKMITEPVAAALAFGVDRKPNERKRCLVFDFGGGTHDVTILEIYKRMISVKAIEGDN